MAAERESEGTPDLQTNISRVVRGLMGLAGVAHQSDLAEVLGVSRSGVTEKLNGDRRWTVEDLQNLARRFDVPVSVFYADPVTVLHQLSTSGYKSATDLVVIDGKVPDQAERKQSIDRPLAAVVT